MQQSVKGLPSLIVLAVGLLWPSVLIAESTPQPVTLNVAVAANFAKPLAKLARDYEIKSGNTIRITVGSSGALFAQIVHGAPFDVFLSADTERPRRLESAGIAIDGSRFTYAIGNLVLWSRDPGFAGSDCKNSLERLQISRLAIANPVTAPYGAASRQALEKLGIWTEARSRLVVGENISQALQFTASGAANLGLVAAAQVKNPNLPAASCLWPIPNDLHSPIEQQAVRLHTGANTQLVAKFTAFLRSDVASAIILRHGYSLPPTVR